MSLTFAGSTAAAYLKDKWPVIEHMDIQRMPLGGLDGTTHLYTFWEGWTADDRMALAARVNASSTMRVGRCQNEALRHQALHLIAITLLTAGAGLCARWTPRHGG